MGNHRLDPNKYEQRFNDLYGAKFELASTYTITTDPIMIRCKVCNNTFSRTRAGNCITKPYQLTCPFCEPNKVTNITIRGIDDLWTTDPDIASLLVDPEDGYKYGRGSSKVVAFKCPNCGKVFEKPISLIIKTGFVCFYCGDGYSYPNKFIKGVLEKLHIPFVHEFHFEGSTFRYDVQFDYDGIKYVVEMDGGYNHGNQDTKDMTVEEQIARDKEKDCLVGYYGYTLIRVDCKYRKTNPEYRFNYVVNSLRNSQLSFLINQLSEKDLWEIDIQCSKYSTFLEFVDYYNNPSITHGYDDLMSKLHISKHTILDYAKRAIALNLISVDYKTFCKTMSKNGWDRISRQRSTPVMCNETGGVFASIKEAQDIMHCHNISYQISGRVKTSGCLPNGTRLTWKKITQEQYLTLKSAS